MAGTSRHGMIGYEGMTLERAGTGSEIKINSINESINESINVLINQSIY